MSVKKIGDTNTRLKPGNYVVQAELAGGASSQLITVEAGSSQEIDVAIKNPNDTQIVASANSTSLTSDNQSLLYLDIPDGKLKQITSQDIIKTLSEGINFKRYDWADTQYGVGLSVDGLLYSYTNKDKSPKTLAGSQPSGISRLSLAQDRSLYVSGGTNTYRYDSSGAFNTIDTTTPDARLAASIEGVLISSSLSDGSDTQDVTYIKTSGTKITATLPKYKDAAWSNNGKRLAISTQSQLNIYDAGLKFISSIPIKDSVSSLAWTETGKLLYSSSNKIWVYDPTTQISNVITSAKGAIKAIQRPNSDGSVYFSVDNPEASGGNQQIAKTNINKLVVTKTTKELQNNLPTSTPQYNIDYINLTQPTIYLYPAEFSDTSYTNIARDYLNTLGVNLKEVTIISE